MALKNLEQALSLISSSEKARFSRRGFFGFAGLAAFTAACGSSGGGGNGSPGPGPVPVNYPPVINGINYLVAEEGKKLSATATGYDPEGTNIDFYLISSSLENAPWNAQVVVDPSGIITTNDPLPYNSEGLHSIKIGAADETGKITEYEDVFNVAYARGPNDLPYEFDSTELTQPSGLIKGYTQAAWENIYFGYADVRALFDSDANNDMGITMANLIDSNPANWEFEDPNNAVFLSNDTIYFFLHNPELNQAEYKGEFIDVVGVNLIMSK